MSVPLKLGVVLLGLGALTVGTVVMLSSSMPQWISLESDSTSDDTFGKKHAKYLVSTIKHSDKTPGVDNALWWYWSYENWKGDVEKDPSQLSDQFKDSSKLSGAFASLKDSSSGSTTNKTLNKLCDEAYKKPSTEIETTNGSGDENKIKYENDIWRYCSPLGVKPSIKA